jgi:hypothetical protein
MSWTVLGGRRSRALLVFCVGAILALLVAVPAAYAAYRHDDGRIRCPRGERPALIVKAKGNPVWVRAHAASGYSVIWDKYNTYSGTTTRVYRASGIYADRGMGWAVDVYGKGAYVSRQATHAYCYNP